MKFVCLLLTLVIFFQFSLESQSQTEIGLVYFLSGVRNCLKRDNPLNPLIRGTGLEDLRDWGTCDGSHDYKQEGAVGKSRPARK